MRHDYTGEFSGRSVTMTSATYSCESGSWSLSYVVRDSFLRFERKDNLSFDAGWEDANPAFMFQKLVEHVQSKFKP